MKHLVTLLPLAFCLCTAGCPVIGATLPFQARQDTVSAAHPDDEELDAPASALQRVKAQFAQTRKEMTETQDPRTKDDYWYALNDTTDRSRYQQIHYAFNRWRDNWTAEVRGGLQGVAMCGVDEKFSLGPQMELGIRKDLHPYWGLRADVTYSHYNHDLFSQHISTMSTNGDDYPGNGQRWWENVKYSTLGVRGFVVVNLLNALAGREMVRSPFSAHLYAGAGLAYSYRDITTRDGSNILPQFYFGSQGGWNINQRYSVILDANVAWSNSDLQGFTNPANVFKFGMTLGLAYRFSKVIHFRRIGFDDDLVPPIIRGVREVNEAGNEILRMEPRPVVQDEVLSRPIPEVAQRPVQSSEPASTPQQEEVEKPVAEQPTKLIATDMIQAAFFQINRIELQQEYVLNLGFYAKIIKNHPDHKFLVKGFADTEVGSLQRNLWLSEQRAKVVADVLIRNYGVNPDQLVVGGGKLDFDIPFPRESHSFNRCTIVCALEGDYQILNKKEESQTSPGSSE